MREEETDALIGAVYEAALEPELWPQALDRLLQLTGAQLAHLFFVDRTDGCVEGSIMWAPHRDPVDIAGAERDYVSYYNKIDPRLELGVESAVGEWIRCHEHFDEAFVRSNEFYNDHLIPHDIRYMMGARLVEVDPYMACIGVHRAVGQPPFGDDDVRRISRLAHHLARAVRLYHKSEALRARLDDGWDALNALHVSLLIVDHRQIVRFANRSAESLLSRCQGLHVRHGRLTHTNPTTRDRLARLVSDASAARGGGAVALQEAAGQVLHLLVIPVAARSRLAAPLQTPLALVVISDPAAQSSVPGRYLGPLFGLTPAEVKLAQALVAGAEPAEYAQQSRLSVHTVRSQLRTLLAKTGVRRQSELVRLLSSLSAVRLDHDRR